MTDKTMELAILGDNESLKKLINHQRVIYGYHGQFALNLMQISFGTPCIPDGEDTSGQQKYRLATPDELVARAVELTTKAFAAIEQNGWAIPQPPLSEIIDKSGEVGFSPRKANAA